jgi:hypothetical protein
MRLTQKVQSATCSVINRGGCASNQEVQEDSQDIDGCAAPKSLRLKDASCNGEGDFRTKKHAGLGEVERSRNQTANGDC